MQDTFIAAYFQGELHWRIALEILGAKVAIISAIVAWMLVGFMLFSNVNQIIGYRLWTNTMTVSTFQSEMAAACLIILAAHILSIRL